MPTVHYKGEWLECERGERLRDVLRRAGLDVHNDEASWLNCKGLGTCGTCAVEIKGEVSPRNARERWRLGFPPHDAKRASRLRLACQVRVEHDLEVHKYPGFWGHLVDEDPL